MNLTFPNLAKFSLAALIASVTIGCASNANLEKMVKDAQAAADHATEVANQANNTANEAKSTADQALSAAQDAQACCKQNSEKIDRMFKKSMQK